jgi:hypothetical protein
MRKHAWLREADKIGRKIKGRRDLAAFGRQSVPPNDDALIGANALC